MNPLVSSGPSILGKIIPDFAREVLRDVLIASGVDSCAITSVARTAGDQARIMYGNLTGTADHQGVQEQLDLYAAAGDKVIEVYVANKDKPRDEVIELMRQKIEELGPGTVSHHCCDPSKIAVFDVAPLSIVKEKQGAFEAAAANDKRITKFLSPHTSDPAYHFEVPLPLVS